MPESSPKDAETPQNYRGNYFFSWEIGTNYHGVKRWKWGVREEKTERGKLDSIESKLRASNYWGLAREFSWFVGGVNWQTLELRGFLLKWFE